MGDQYPNEAPQQNLPDGWNPNTPAPDPADPFTQVQRDQGGLGARSPLADQSIPRRRRTMDLTERSPLEEEAAPRSPMPEGWNAPIDVSGNERLQQLTISALQQADPQAALDRINSAVFLSDIFNEDPGYVYDNIDMYSERYFGAQMETKSLRQAVQDEWLRGRYQVSMGRLGFDAIFADEDRWPELIEEINQYAAQIPSQDLQQRGLPAYIMKAMANMLPMMLASMSEGWKTATISGLAGGTTAALLGQAGPQIALPEEIITVPGAFVTSATIGLMAGSAVEAARIEGGLIMADLMQTVAQNVGTEENPEYEGAWIARAAALGAGAVIGLIEQSQISQLFKGSGAARRAFQAAIQKFARNAHVSGVFNNAATRFLSNYGTNITSETLQELAQESVGMASEEFSILLANELQDRDIPQATIDEWVFMATETMKQSAAAFSGLSLPASVRNTVNDIRDSRQRSESRRQITQALDDLRARNPELADQLIRSLTDEAIAEQEQASDGAEGPSDEQTTESRAEEVQSTVERIQQNLSRLRNARNHVEDADVAVIDEEIALNEQLLEEAQLEAEGYESVQAGRTEAWQMTPEEFETSRAQRQPESFAFDSPVRQRIHEAMPQLSSEEVDAAGLLIEMRAEATGQSVQDYVATTFQEGIFSDPQTAEQTVRTRRAAVSFDSQGRALIHAVRQSDFGSFVHEMGHVLRQQLPEDFRSVAEAWAGAENGNWTREAEERFAEAFETYIREGKAPTPQLRTVFQKLADWMRRVVGAVRQRWHLDPQVTQTFDSLFTSAGEAPVQQEARTLYQEQPKTEFEQAAAEYRANPESRPKQNKHGLAPYMRENTGLDPTQEFKLAKSPKKHLAEKNLKVVDEILQKHPNAAESLENWQQMMVDAVGDSEIPLSPRNIIKMLSDVDTWARWFSRLSDKQLEMANEGAVTGQELRRAYENGSATVEVTGRLILWGILSRGVSPFVQEGGFIDALMGADKFIRLAAEGRFDDKALKDYQAWAKNLMGAGSGVPGAGTSHNLNAFGETTLRKMGTPGEDGITPLQKLHDMIADSSIPSKDIRRALYQMVESPGFDLKILSFILLVTGKTDVIILDRVQLRNMWNDGSLGGYNLYDGITEKVPAPTAKDPDNTKDVYVKGTRFSDVLSGMRGVLIYEALERGIQEKVEQLYEKVGRRDDASIGRYHWESWVLASNQEVGHGTIEMLLAEMRGEEHPRAGYYVREGKYNTWNYGAMYLHDVFDQGWYVYEKSNGQKYAFTVPEWKTFISRVKLKSSGVVGEGFPNISEHTNQPWRQHEAVNNENLDRLIEEHGTGVEELRRQRASQTGLTEGASGSAGGRILFQPGDDAASNHERAVRRAVAEYKPVPDAVLERYRGREWADQELARREREQQIQEVTSGLREIARQYDTPEEFQAAMEDAAGESPGETAEWYQKFWNRAVNADLTRDEAQKRWLKGMRSKKDVEQFLQLLMANREQYINDPGLPALLWGIAQRRGEEVSDAVYESVLKMVRNNPTKYRRIEAEMLGDTETLRQIAREDEVARLEREAKNRDEELDKVDPGDDRMRIARDVEDTERRAKIYAGEISGESMDATVEQLTEELQQAREEIQRLMDEMPEGVRDWARKDKVYRDLKRKLDAAERKNQKGKKQKENLKALREETERAYKDALRSAGQEARMIAEDQRQAYRDALKSAQQESRLNLEQADQIYRDIIKSAQQESRMLYNEAVRAERRKWQERQAAKRMRKYMQDLARKITKPVPSTIDFEYAELIESIQAGIDPAFRSPHTLDMWKRRREYFERNPDKLSELPKKTRDKLYKRSLNDFTVAELEDLARYRKDLEDLGRTKRRLQQNQLDRAVQSEVDEMLNAILAGEQLAEQEDRIINRQDKTLQEVWVSKDRPERIADRLDGKKEFSGPVHKNFIKRVRQARGRALRNQFQREARLERVMERLGITEKDLGQQIEVDGTKYTVEQAMDIYAKMKNERSRLALLYGNNLDPEHISNILDALTDNQKKLADAIIMEYEQNYNRLREAHILIENKDLGHEPYYTPLLRQGEDYESHEKQLSDEILIRHGLKKAAQDKGFTVQRKDIPAEFQKATRLGIYSIWKQQVAKQEHYIEGAQDLQRLRKYLGTPRFKAAIRQRFGEAYLKELDKFVSRFANPNIYRSFTPLNKIARMLRRNAATAYLAFNAVTSAKQTISLAFYLPYAGHHIGGAIAEFTANPKKMIDWVAEVAPQLKERAIMRSMEELRPRENEMSKGLAKMQERLANAGMTPIRFLDMITVTIGFKATYDAVVEQMGHDAAVEHALGATLRTQPAADPTEVPSMYAEDNMWGFFLQFTNQLNQIWHMAFYDAPAAIKNGHFWQAAASYFAVALSGMMIWALGTRSFPDEPDDFSEAAMEQLMAMFPLLGTTILSTYNGFDAEVPATMPTRALGLLARLGTRLASGDNISEGAALHASKQVAEALAIVFGLPYIGPERAITGTVRSLNEDSAWPLLQEIFLGGETIEEERK